MKEMMEGFLRAIMNDKGQVNTRQGIFVFFSVAIGGLDKKCENSLYAVLAGLRLS